MKTIRDLLNQFNAEVSLFLSLLGIGLGLGFSNDSVTILKWILFFLFISNAYLLIYIVQFKRKIKRLHNTADNLTLEVINRFRFRKPINTGLSYLNINHIVRFKKFDIEIEYEFKGVCTDKSGADSLFLEIYADSNISFDDLDFRYVDCGNAPHLVNRGKLVQEDRKLFLIQARFSKRLGYEDLFHVRYSCTLKNSVNYGEDYFTTGIQKNNRVIKSFSFALEFYDEKPDFLEVFDATEGGPSVFLMKLEPQGDSSPFVYKHNLAEIAQSKDFAYKFKRKLT